MTREEREKVIDALKISAPVMAVTQEEFNDYIQTLNKIMDWLQQEPCTDAISRQAVLDMLEDINAETEGVGFYYEHYVEYIKKLPPVTPQYTDTEIQKMQDLESAEIQKAYEIGKAENPNKWIPVSEMLPKGYERVLVTRRMFHWANEPVEYTVGIESFSGNVDFVAWMPLPEPYKQEVEE